MNKQVLRLVIVFSVITAALPSLSWAGNARTDDHQFEPAVITAFAKSVEQYAAEQEALVFILGRVGRPEDKLPAGINFTHTAIAVYSSIQLENGKTAKGYAIHNLYQKSDKVSESELVIDYPVDFFWSAKSLKAGIIIPEKELQLRLIDVLASEAATTLHNPKYSAIANPFNTIFQNCTEYTLDIINAAIYSTTDIVQLKANAKAHFIPTIIKESPLKLIFGSLLMPDVSTRDHSGKVATATFGSIANYLQLNELNKLAIILDNKENISSAL